MLSLRCVAGEQGSRPCAALTSPRSSTSVVATGWSSASRAALITWRRSRSESACPCLTGRRRNDERRTTRGPTKHQSRRSESLPVSPPDARSSSRDVVDDAPGAGGPSSVLVGPGAPGRPLGVRAQGGPRRRALVGPTASAPLNCPPSHDHHRFVHGFSCLDHAWWWFLPSATGWIAPSVEGNARAHDESPRVQSSCRDARSALRGAPADKRGSCVRSRHAPAIPAESEGPARVVDN